MTLSYRLYDTIDRVPLDDWNEASQEGSHGFMDANFLRAVEKGLEGQARIFHVLIREEDGKPAACASLSLMPVDLLLLAGPRIQKVVGWVRKLAPNLGKVNILMCGLPFSAGQSHLAFAPGADRAGAVLLLDTLLRELARRHGARLIVFKEFGDEARAYLDPLQERGYCRAASPASYAMPKAFASLADYGAALKRHYRYTIRSSQQKFERAGCRTVHLEDPEEIRRVYTPEVHGLYEAIVAKSDLKLEVLPHSFFHELAAQLPGRVSLTVVYRQERPIAFAWGLSADPESYGLFCGIDADHNAECDLYFNVVYQYLDYAFRRGCRRITLGQTAESFKTRLGCVGEARHVYARGAGPLVSWVLRRSAGFLFPERPITPAHDVFKAPEPARPRKKALPVG
jgi:predicted N-acyltransferase